MEPSFLSLPDFDDIRLALFNMGDIIHHGLTNPVPQRSGPILEALGDMIRNYGVAPVAAYGELHRALCKGGVQAEAAVAIRRLCKEWLRGRRPLWNVVLLCNELCDHGPEEAIKTAMRIIDSKDLR